MTRPDSSADSVDTCMTHEVFCVRADDDVPDAVRGMVNHGIDGAPVLDESGRLVGMLSASDVIVQGAQVHLPTIITMFGASLELPGSAKRYEQDLKQALASKVADLMITHPVTISPEASVSEAATSMHDHDVSRLPVVDDDGRVVGIIARGDVLRYLVATGEGEG